MKLKIGVLLFFLFQVYGPTWANEKRFPNPEFNSNYQLPSEVFKQPGLASDPYLALITLVLVLALTINILYYRRSRKAMRYLIVLSLVYFGFYHKGCICAIGSLQNMAYSLVNPEVTLPLLVVGIFFIPLLIALFWGRVFCVAACPLGALQELVIFRPLKIPAWLDRALKIIPYIYLGLAILFAMNQLGFIICEYDPFVGFFRFSATWPMFTFGAVLLLIGTRVARPYCRYLCPYSVLLRWAAKLATRKVVTTPSDCINCHLCRDSCPVEAIKPPQLKKNLVPKAQLLEKIQWILALSPLILGGGIVLGGMLTAPLATLHPKISLLNELNLNSESDAAMSFLMKGQALKELEIQVAQAYHRLKLSSILFGAYLALVFIGMLLALHRRRENQEYQVDCSECISCAQCYAYCPQGQHTI